MVVVVVAVGVGVGCGGCGSGCGCGLWWLVAVAGAVGSGQWVSVLQCWVSVLQWLGFSDGGW